MIATLELTPQQPSVQREPQTESATRKRGRLRRFFFSALKLFVGVICCQGPVLALVVVGWTQRRMQRKALQRWAPDVTIESPPWWRALIQCGTRGASAAGNVFLLTLPATSLWYFAWVLGWNISFHKQYEQSHLGVSLGVSGVLLFGLAMLYLPVALSRQAVNADWRAFWRIRENVRLVRRVAPWQTPWAIGFLIAASILLVVRLAPYFFSASEAGNALSEAELVAWAEGYYFWTGFLVLPLYVVLWTSAARTYAGAIAGLAEAPRSRVQLTPIERAIVSSRTRPSPSKRDARWAGRLVGWGTRQLGRMGAVVGLGTTFAVWALVALQVFIAQFFYYIPAQGWLNHPLILLPWMRYLPPGLPQ